MHIVFLRSYPDLRDGIYQSVRCLERGVYWNITAHRFRDRIVCGHLTLPILNYGGVEDIPVKNRGVSLTAFASADIFTDAVIVIIRTDIANVVDFERVARSIANVAEPKTASLRGM